MSNVSNDAVDKSMEALGAAADADDLDKTVYYSGKATTCATLAVLSCLIEIKKELKQIREKLDR